MQFVATKSDLLSEETATSVAGDQSVDGEGNHAVSSMALKTAREHCTAYGLSDPEVCACVALLCGF